MLQRILCSFTTLWRIITEVTKAFGVDQAADAVIGPESFIHRIPTQATVAKQEATTATRNAA